MTFAAYDAGPGNYRKIRKATIASRLNPNLWFSNMEVGTAKAIGMETVQYVANVFKYYVSFKLSEQEMAGKEPVSPAAATSLPP
jgi:membrane-bound lytic murein transglycosylase MltF